MGEVIDFNTGLSHKEPYPSVISVLERALARAKSGEVVAVSVVLCDGCGQHTTAWACGPNEDIVFYNALVAGSSFLTHRLNVSNLEISDLVPPPTPEIA